MHPTEIVLATGNPGKRAEFQALLGGLRVELLQLDPTVPECPEPFGTFVENALAKARHASSHTGKPALADDSGLCVRALGGAPGVLSARYAAADAEQGVPRAEQDARNNQLLLQRLQGVGERRAHFVCVLVALRHAQDPEPLIAHGWLHGHVAGAPAGDAGFGYDPLFVLPQRGLTLAQLEAAEKNRLSHRARAAAQMTQLLEAFWGVAPSAEDQAI
jgi:XTP/dITP diphosphohydrolase